MPRKQKQEKQTITVLVNGDPIKVTLHPPTEKRKAWYAYWAGCVYSRSTNQTDLTEAVRVAESMVKNGGKPVTLAGNILTDEEFEAIQRAHFAKKTDSASKVRAEKSLESCLESIAAFKKLTGLPHAAMATADDCARFQVEALKLPNNWRREYPKARADAECLSANTVLKWCRSLQAAFERANRNAGKKCVRGVVEEQKLLTVNPWAQFTWIEGTERPIRHFDADDLVSLLTFLETAGRHVPVAALAAKVFLWSCCRKHEVAGLEWKQARLVTEDQRVVILEDGGQKLERHRIKETHFHVIGKWGVERWFRVPEALFHDLLAQRTDSPFVFAAYTDQIRVAHADNPGCLKKIKDEFTPQNFGRWFYERVKEWSGSHPDGAAYVHVFRKTALQMALDGEEEEASQKVAKDAGVTEGVLLGHYARPKLWRKSNRTYNRIRTSLPPEVAQRYGHVEDERARLERQLRQAVEGQNWELVATLSAHLGKKGRPEAM